MFSNKKVLVLLCCIIACITLYPRIFEDDSKLLSQMKRLLPLCQSCWASDCFLFWFFASKGLPISLYTCKTTSPKTVLCTICDHRFFQNRCPNLQKQTVSASIESLSTPVLLIPVLHTKKYVMVAYFELHLCALGCSAPYFFTFFNHAHLEKLFIFIQFLMPVRL